MSENRIAVVAHNRMKPTLLEFLKERQEWFWGRKLVSTGLTAGFLKDNGIKADVEQMRPGKEGGFMDLRDMVAEGKIDMVLFFRDPEIFQEYEHEIIEFLKECNRNNLPLATNPASGELLVLGMIKKESSQRTRDRVTNLNK